MKIRILGTRGEIKVSDKYHGRHSGILVDDEILFDLGEEDFLEHNPKAVFITHLHPDHAFFVLRDKTVPKNSIYAPESFDSYSNIVPVAAKTYVGPYMVTPIPTVHSKLVKSHAYLIEKDNIRVLYTGDIIWIEKKYWKQFGRLDLAITDGSYIRKGGLVRKDKEGNLFGHTGIPNLIKFFAPYTSKILFVHFGNWFFKEEKPEEKIRSLGSEKLEVIAGHDGLILDL